MPGMPAHRASVGGTIMAGAAETTCIKVLVRVRPATGEHEQFQQCVKVGAEGSVVVTLPKTMRNPHGEAAHSFRFDHVAPHDASQQHVFEQVGKEACEGFLDGFNAAVFAYGQTGSGKTYSMYGHPHDEHRRGLIPRSLELIFAKLHEKRQNGCAVSCKVTLTEIYNEQVIDLLTGDARMLQLRENPLTGNVYVEGARFVSLINVQDTLKLVDTGIERRVVAGTGCNDSSSRSHCILTLHLDVEDTVGGTRVLRTSCLHLVGRNSQMSFLGVCLKTRISDSNMIFRPGCLGSR